MNDFINAMVEAYLEAAAWSSSGDNDEPLDDGTPFSLTAQKKALGDCCDFWNIVKGFDGLSKLSSQTLGHDFWLTRNHHGVGFWDRGLGELGEKLTEVAHTFGEAYVYRNDEADELEMS